MRWLLTACIFQITYSSTFAVCPTGMIKYPNSNICYLFERESSTYLRALTVCNIKTGFLASIHDAFQNSFIHDLAEGVNDFWIGATDYVTGNWSWVDGTPFIFSDWATNGQPSTLPGYDCGAVELNSGTWKTDLCDNSKPFVCVYYLPESPTTNLPPQRTTTTTSPSNICQDGWTYFDKTGYCYYIRDTKTNWEDAEKWCFDENSHLVSIHSKNENDFVKNLTSLDTSGVCNVEQFAWTGLYSVTNLLTWRWTDDSPYNYHNWAPSRPNNADLHAYCALTSPIVCQGEWLNAKCDDPYRFSVCKKLPNGQTCPQCC